MEHREKEKAWESIRSKVEGYVYSRYGAKDFEDNRQEAFIGVWRGLDKFDPKVKGANLELWCIRAANEAVKRSKQRMSIINPADYAKQKKVKSIEERLRQQNMFSLSLLQQLSGLEEKEFDTIYNLDNVRYPMSLHSPAYGEENAGETLLDTLPQEDKQGSTLGSFLRDNLKKLSQEDQFIIILYDLLGVEMEEVARIESKKRTTSALYAQRTRALEKLRRVVSGKTRDGEGEISEATTTREVLQYLLG